MAFIRWKRSNAKKNTNYNPYVKNYKGNSNNTQTTTEVQPMRMRRTTSVARMTAMANRKKRRRRWGQPLAKMAVTGAKIYSTIKKGRTPRQRVRTVAAGSSFSSYTKYYKGSKPVAKAYRRISPIQYYTDVSSTRVTTITSTEASGCGKQAAIGFPMLRPTALSTLMVAAGGSGYTTDFLMRNAQFRYTITNQENVNVFVDLYEVSMRPNRCAIDGPVIAWDTGLTHENGSTVTSASYGTTPYASRAFTTMYKINKVTHLELGAGRSHRHNVKLVYNRMINKEELTELPSTAYGLYPFTNVMVMVAYGAPINDVSTKSNVSSGPVALDVVTSLKYEYQYVEPNLTTYTYGNALPSITTPNVQDYGNSSAESTSAA